MNYIIEKGNAYSIKGDKAYKVEFALDGSMKISDKEKDAIDVKGKAKYTYDEVLKKLNVKYMIQKALEEQEMPVRDEKLIEEIKALKEEKEGLDAYIKELEEEIANLKAEKLTSEENPEEGKENPEEGKENPETEK